MGIPSMDLLGAVVPASASWTPASLTGIAHWYDASQAGDITLVSSTHVSQWNDRVGSKHLTQTTDAKRPWYDTTVNGLGCVRFDGGDWMENTAVALNGTTLTVFAVVRGNTGTTAAYGRVVSIAASTNGLDYTSAAAGCVMAYYNTGPDLRSYRNGASLGNKAYSLNTGPVAAVSQFDGTNHTMYVDGSAGTAVASSGSFAATHLRIGETTDGSGTFWLGPMCEIAIVVGSSSSTDRSDWRTYCQSKWGTA